MSAFQYPTLNRGEIVDILVQSQIASISATDLQNPTFEFVSALFSNILAYLDLLREDEGQVDFEALGRLENPELHVESVRVINLWHKVRKVVSAVECPDRFTLRDLLRPNPRRTEMFLSAILNFCVYKDTKMNMIKPFIDDLTSLEERCQEFEANICKFKGEIANFKDAREKEMPQVQEVETKVNELRMSLSGLNNEQMSLRSSFRKMKEEVQVMDEKISNAEFVLVQAVQENANLHSQIVQSPDKLQSALEEKRSIRDEAKNAERSAMQFFQERTAAVEVITKALKKIKKQFSQVQAVQEQVNSSKAMEKDVKALKAKLVDDEMLDKSLLAKLIEQEGKAEHLDEVKRQLEKERDRKYEESLKELDGVKSEVALRRRDLEARQKKIEAVVAEADVTYSEISSLKESGVAKQQLLLQKAEEIVKEFQQYSNSTDDLLLRIQETPKLKDSKKVSNKSEGLKCNDPIELIGLK